MFCVKVHEVGGDVLVAACDPEILGKTFVDGGLKITPSVSFYGEDVKEKNELLEEIKCATIVNLLGDKVVDVVVEEGIVEEKNVTVVCGLKHAQIIVVPPESTTAP